MYTEQGPLWMKQWAVTIALGLAVNSRSILVWIADLVAPDDHW